MADRRLGPTRDFRPLVVDGYDHGDPRAGGRKPGWYLDARMAVYDEAGGLPPWPGGPADPAPLVIGGEADPSGL
jgi:hypothetical protein